MSAGNDTSHADQLNPVGGEMTESEDVRRFELTWVIKCLACDATSSGGAETPGEAYGAMARFYERTCKSFHFEEPSDA